MDIGETDPTVCLLNEGPFPLETSVSLCRPLRMSDSEMLGTRLLLWLAAPAERVGIRMTYRAGPEAQLVECLPPLTRVLSPALYKWGVLCLT